MRLVATSGDQTLSFPLRPGSTIIGRHASCHISIPAKGVSRRHCQIYVDGDTAVLRDLGSANGTFVNRQRAEDKIELREGDRIDLGNFRLRVHVADGPATVLDAEPGTSTESLAVGAAPAGGPIPAEVHDAEPYPEDAPPAPTDFPEEPEADDTPVDADFVPGAYAEDDGHALPDAEAGALVLSQGVAMQPQLVVRDGRWFLRDPRTGREVEISPKDANAAAGVLPAEGAARRPNTRLLVAIIAVAAVLVVGFAAVFLKPPPVTTGGRVPVDAYNDVVVRALNDIRGDKIDDALQRLDKAEEARKDIGTARLVAQYVRLKQAEKIDKKFPWEQARNWLQSIEDIGSAPDEVLAYTKEQLNWIDRELMLIGRLHEVQAELAQDPSIENRMEVYRKLAEFEAGYIASADAKAEAQRLRAEIGKYYLDRARRAQDSRNWDEAVGNYQRALPHLDDKTAASKQIVLCQQAMADERTLKDARAAQSNDQLNTAESLAKGIKPASLFYDDAQAIVRQIATTRTQRVRQGHVGRATSLWQSGNATEAIKIAEEHGLQELDHIKTTYAEWQRVMAQAKAALAAEDYSKARQLYEQAAALPGDAKNAYSQQAKRAGEDIRANYPTYAQKLANRGFLLIATDPRKARTELEKALSYDGTNVRAKKGVDTLHRTAARLYNDARGIMAQEMFRNALVKLEQAKANAEPGSELDVHINKAIAECKQSLGGLP